MKTIINKRHVEKQYLMRKINLIINNIQKQFLINPFDYAKKKHQKQILKK